MKLAERLFNYKKNNKNTKEKATSWFLDYIESTKGIDVGSMNIGKFYYFKYDLKSLNKSTRIEQLAPVLIIDYNKNIEKNTLWCINFNFLPSDIRYILIYNLISRNETFLESNKKIKNILQEKPIPNISYQIVTPILASYNLLYTTAIRPFNIQLLNTIIPLSFNNIEEIMNLDMKKISGMDDQGINKVLEGKLKNEGYAPKFDEMFIVKQSYEKTLNELKEKFEELEKLLKK